jgi:hypothetical protein
MRLEDNHRLDSSSSVGSSNPSNDLILGAERVERRVNVVPGLNMHCLCTVVPRHVNITTRPNHRYLNGLNSPLLEVEMDEAS